MKTYKVTYMNKAGKLTSKKVWVQPDMSDIVQNLKKEDIPAEAIWKMQLVFEEL